MSLKGITGNDDDDDDSIPTQPSENLQAFTLCELKTEIKLLNPHRAPRIELITAHMLKELPHEGYLNLLYVLNAIRRLEYLPAPLKQAKVIMIPKPGKKKPHTCHIIPTN